MNQNSDPGGRDINDIAAETGPRLNKKERD